MQNDVRFKLVISASLTRGIYIKHEQDFPRIQHEDQDVDSFGTSSDISFTFINISTNQHTCYCFPSNVLAYANNNGRIALPTNEEPKNWKLPDDFIARLIRSEWPWDFSGLITNPKEWNKMTTIYKGYLHRKDNGTIADRRDDQNARLGDEAVEYADNNDSHIKMMRFALKNALGMVETDCSLARDIISYCENNARDDSTQYTMTIHPLPDIPFISCLRLIYQDIEYPGKPALDPLEFLEFKDIKILELQCCFIFKSPSESSHMPYNTAYMDVSKTALAGKEMLLLTISDEFAPRGIQVRFMEHNTNLIKFSGEDIISLLSRFNIDTVIIDPDPKKIDKTSLVKLSTGLDICINLEQSITIIRGYSPCLHDDTLNRIASLIKVSVQRRWDQVNYRNYCELGSPNAQNILDHFYNEVDATSAPLRLYLREIQKNLTERTAAHSELFSTRKPYKHYKLSGRDESGMTHTKSTITTEPSGGSVANSNKI